ncbi:MAG TPA: thiamine-phosphate kinase [Candidatus Eremiobacteraceae bacterium]|nr:thiamine-phosphate kinase [Candidatus Eremiobacteraceae bacterium]
MRISWTNKAPHLTEDSLIRQIESHFHAAANRNSGLRLAIGDDAAIFRPSPAYEIVLTCDWFLEKTHFLRKIHPPEAVGWKCLARAVSDIAAMGGQPRCFLLSVALPKICTGNWCDEFLRGLRKASAKLACPLAGGDTTRRDEILIHITVVGEVKQGTGALRSSARPKDRIFVSGCLGEAELGWELAKRSRGLVDRHNELLRKHLHPQPRIELGHWLVQNKFASAMMDLSDGLSSDLTRLCEASGVGAAIQCKNLPLSSPIFSSEFSKKKRLAAALHGGDDYELLFCVRKDKARQIPPKLHGVKLTEIGEVTAKRRLLLIGASGEVNPIRPGGWDPFGN